MYHIYEFLLRSEDWRVDDLYKVKWGKSFPHLDKVGELVSGVYIRVCRTMTSTDLTKVYSKIMNEWNIQYITIERYSKIYNRRL